MVSDINKLGLDVKWQDLTLGCTGAMSMSATPVPLMFILKHLIK